uniref:Putative tail fiber protein n=1 Tax=viral metagenome TaxID=1070528 RepID=A0A6M3IVS9_9ZZZZ
MSLKSGLNTLGGYIHIGTRLDIKHFVPDEKGKHLRPLEDGSMGQFTEVKKDRRVEINRVVTDAFVNYVVDNLQAELAAFGDFKFHEMGLGVVAEAAGDTALGTTTGIARATGTQIEGATANIYKSVGTITADTTEAITEHGLFNIATAGTMMDRTVFAAINVVSGNQIEFTFQITFSSGG